MSFFHWNSRGALAQAHKASVDFKKKICHSRNSLSWHISISNKKYIYLSFFPTRDEEKWRIIMDRFETMRRHSKVTTKEVTEIHRYWRLVSPARTWIHFLTAPSCGRSLVCCGPITGLPYGASGFYRPMGSALPKRKAWGNVERECE